MKIKKSDIGIKKEQRRVLHILNWLISSLGTSAVDGYQKSILKEAIAIIRYKKGERG